MEVKNSLICLLRYFLDLKCSGILLVKCFPICFTGQYHLKMPRVYTNHLIKTALMCSNFIELMYNLQYYMIILQYITWYTKKAATWKMLLL